MLASFLNDIRDGDIIQPRRLAERLKMPMTHLSKLAHVNRNVLASKPDSPAVQAKLGEIARIVSRAADLTGDVGAAIIWFKYQPIVGFGGKTAEDLVEEGRHEAVGLFLDDLEAGSFA